MAYEENLNGGRRGRGFSKEGEGSSEDGGVVYAKADVVDTESASFLIFCEQAGVQTTVVSTYM